MLTLKGGSYVVKAVRERVDALRSPDCKHPWAVTAHLTVLLCRECNCFLNEGKLEPLNAGPKEPGLEYLSSYSTERLTKA